MSTPLELFIRDTIKRARTELPYLDAVECLRGLSLGFVDKIENISRLSTTVANLVECDQQLELIATGQLRLDFRDDSKDERVLPRLGTTAERLKWARKQSGFRSVYICQETGLCRSAIYDIERAVRPVTPAALESLARVYDLPISWLATGQLEAAPQAA